MLRSPPSYDQSALAARAEIADVLMRYCHATDRRRWWLMDTVFHDDATAKVSVLPGGHWREFVKQGASLLEPVGTTHHQIGNMQIAIEGDTAHVETYVTAFHRVPADAPPGGPFAGSGEAYDAVFGARYIDRFERRDGKWRIADHSSIPDFRHYRPVNEGAMASLEGPPDVDPSIKVVAGWQE